MKGKGIILLIILAQLSHAVRAQNNVPEKMNNMIGLMSPSQKVAQLTGKTLFAMADDEELGIPGWLMSDGPHGVHRQGYTSFPTGIAMAALWDRQLLLRLGHAMGEEFWAAGQHVALAPCIDLCLDPRGGRTAESAGEDPYMSGQIGKYIVRGIQSMPVMACLKHFEIEGKQAYRKTCDEIIAERDLMGFFGTNFRTALQEGVGDLGVPFGGHNGHCPRAAVGYRRGVVVGEIDFLHYYNRMNVFFIITCGA